MYFEAFFIFKEELKSIIALIVLVEQFSTDAPQSHWLGATFFFLIFLGSLVNSCVKLHNVVCADQNIFSGTIFY